MIVYLDTSALVKLYVDEPGTPEVQQLLQRATAVSTSRISYVEARAVFARRQRERALSKSHHIQLIRALERDWETYVRLELTESLIKLAGDLTERHALRADDAIQLASALSIRPHVPVEFAAADDILLKAASRERLPIHPILL